MQREDGILEGQEGIVRKIQKLLSLAASPNEAEAALAMARAQSLLAQHNLDYAMVKDAVVEGGTKAAAPEARERVQVSRSAMYQWQRDLWRAIAQANFCWYWTITDWKGGKRGGAVKRHALLGRVSNVISVRLMGEYLMDTLERMIPYPNTERLSRSAISWRSGCAETLIERIEEEAERRKQETPSASAADGALVRLVDVYEAEHRANYDAHYGEGAYARKLISDANWEAKKAERDRKAQEAEEKAERDWLDYLANESPEQKQLREKQEAKERRAEERRNSRRRTSYRSYYRASDAKEVDRSAIRAGREAGRSINLSAQVSETKSSPRKALT